MAHDDVDWALAASARPAEGVDAILDAARLAAAESDAAVAVARWSAVAGPVHAHQAAHLAARAWGRGRSRARTLDAELLVCLAGTRQVAEGIDRAGVLDGQRWTAIALGTRSGAAARALDALFRRLGQEPRLDHPDAETVIRGFGFPRPTRAGTAEDAVKTLLEALALAALARVG